MAEEEKRKEETGLPENPADAEQTEEAVGPEDSENPEVSKEGPAENVLISNQTLRVFVAMYLGYVVTQLMKSVIQGETVGTEAVLFCVISVFFLSAVVWLVWPAVKQLKERSSHE